MHLEGTVWTGLFDGFFALSSMLLAVFFGAALGNVIRGVPLNAEYFFFEPLWTTFVPRGETGILDWYTVLTGVFALVVVTMHGALYVAMKTLGDVHERASRLARRILPAVIALTVIGVPVTALVRSATLDNYRAHPLLFVFPLAVAISLAAISHYGSRKAETAAFLSSCAYIVTMLCGAAVALYPSLLPSSNGAAGDITIYNAASGHYALSVGLIWWGIGMALAIGYFIFVYRMFRGKVTSEAGAGH
jgi:cytochrome d ubiquinol oxidase subunit II